MLSGKPADILVGGACTFQLPPDPTCASRARSLLAATMRELHLPPGLIDDAKLAVSELATNALNHASSPWFRGMALPELWVWSRTHPASELVVSVFDAHRELWPVNTSTELLDDHGKGLAIVAALSSCTGAHWSRARFRTSCEGKRVWFALGLSAPWPMADRIVPPAAAACRLSEVLQARGIQVSRRTDDAGISILAAGGLNVWVEPKAFSWRTGQGYVQQPLIDLHETAEHIVSQLEAQR
ncbi:ATP-binding protein [Actinomadura verrucosospora]|uniref:Putative anti-sigma regulatory factor, serine/threonine protein kinase n=1 Tax=Actinomadura verrucosospora TaxID=46165 RepID=A0A7D3VQX2_ACTVE|nr:ATP-binding protein [Actinomadura verrucosospora]QKG20113.1 putative anti-sigma regulatory factor, serine/threonine protein kinase [Actinomadura verrucosospora]